MIHAAVYGRLGGDPIEPQTRSDPIATAPLAMNASRGDGPDETEWISIIAFGNAAAELTRHHKGTRSR